MLQNRCHRSAAVRSSSDPVSGCTGDMLNAVPTASGWFFDSRNALISHALREVDRMRRLDRIVGFLAAGSMNALRITEHREDPRLVERHPVLHAIAKCVGHHGGIVAKNLGEVAIGPSAGIFERLRQIPMIERHPRLDFALEHLVHDALVEVEALLINPTLAVGHDARP